ncbi:hypothetical protein WME91_19285 [Sorangium sp. So ce269]
MYTSIVHCFDLVRHGNYHDGHVELWARGCVVQLCCGEAASGPLSSPIHARVPTPAHSASSDGMGNSM